MPKRRFRIALFAIFVAATGAVGLYAWVNTGRPPEASRSATTVRVAVGTVAKKVVLSGMAVSRRQAGVTPPATGRVRQILVTRGAKVAPGTALFEMDERQAALDVERKRLALLRARLSSARAEQAPPDTGNDSSALIEQELRELETRIAEREFEDAKRALAETTVRSPIDGVVLQIAAREGDVVTANQPVVTVADASEAHIDVEGDEYETAQISAGQPATVFFDAFGSESSVGHVVQAPTVRRARSGSGSPAIFAFSVALERVPDWAKLGMSARIEIVVSKRERVPIIPLETVVRLGGKNVVLVRHGRAVQAMDVRLGLQDDWVVELVEGPPVGSELLIDTADIMSRIAETR